MCYDKTKVKQLSPSNLAFVGDGVYGLEARVRLAEINRPSGELHSLSVKLVSAQGQVHAFSLISNMLSEEEMWIFKRGRNFHTGRTPKNASGSDYHTATGIETLFGYLYLCGEKQRIEELFSVIWEDFSATL
jgi:ribonuclease-3 family protein